MAMHLVNVLSNFSSIRNGDYGTKIGSRQDSLLYVKELAKTISIGTKLRMVMPP